MLVKVTKSPLQKPLFSNGVKAQLSKNPLLWHFLLLTLAFLNNPANAADVNNDKFNLSLGGYSLTRYESSMSLTDKSSGVGASISPADTLGIETQQTTVLQLRGYYRFNRRHSLTYSWYSIRKNGSRILNTEISWVDENGDPITIPVGAEVNTSMQYDIYKLGYLWSFYNSDKVTLDAGAGLHITRIAVGLTADTTSSGFDARSVKGTLPLPVLALGLTYRISPKLRWYLKSEAFTLAIGEWDGIYTDQQLGLEYNVFKYVGLGVGIGSNSLDVTRETNDYRFNYENRITGMLFYLTANF